MILTFTPFYSTLITQLNQNKMQPKNKEILHSIDVSNRQMDPIETNSANYDDTELANAAARDIGRINDIINHDSTLTRVEKHQLYSEGCDLRLDWLYASSGGEALPLAEFNGQLEADKEFFARALEQSKQVPQESKFHHETYPQSLWDIKLKQLDLMSLQAYRNANEAQTNLRGTENGRKAWAFADNLMRGVLADSINLMDSISLVAKGDDKLAQDARGKLYEVMLLSYARLMTYEDETFNKVFVRSALSREDRPWDNHASPRRAFDIVVEADGQKKLLQAKNHRNSTEYAWPIRKITDEHFDNTLDNSQRLVNSFKLVLANPSRPDMKLPLERAARMLDRTFAGEMADILENA